MSQIFLSIEANSHSYLTKWIGKFGQNGFSAVDLSKSDRLLRLTDLPVSLDLLAIE